MDMNNKTLIFIDEDIEERYGTQLALEYYTRKCNKLNKENDALKEKIELISKYGNAQEKEFNTEVKRLLEKIKGLEEYKWMYEDLCK